MSSAAMRWLLGPPGDFRRLGAFGVCGGAGIIGAAIGFRQSHLRSSPIVDAAAQQVRSAEAVRTLLGGPVASTSGIVAGYIDLMNGTAVITLPIVSEAGVRAEARVEAEAEWVVLGAEARARGEEPPAAPVNRVSSDCRWLLRHLEVELLDAALPGTAAAAGGAAGEASSAAASVTLYSVPAHVPLSPWAPSREPSRLPRSVRALLPNPAAVREDAAAGRVITVAGVALLMHLVAFLALRRRTIDERAIRRAEALLTLPETPALSALRDAAVAAANSAPRAAADAGIVRQPGAALYGRALPHEVIGYTALESNKELFFRAERVAVRLGAGGGLRARPGGMAYEWVLTHLAVEPTVLYSSRLAKLPEGASAAECLAALQAIQAPPLHLGPADQRVRLPDGASVEAVGAAAAAANASTSTRTAPR